MGRKVISYALRIFCLCLVAVHLATPLACAVHNLHSGGGASQARDSDHGSGHGKHGDHSHDAASLELCLLSTALTGAVDNHAAYRSVQVNWLKTAENPSTRLPDVPQPVPIQIVISHS